MLHLINLPWLCYIADMFYRCKMLVQNIGEQLPKPEHWYYEDFAWAEYTIEA